MNSRKNDCQNFHIMTTDRVQKNKKKVLQTNPHTPLDEGKNNNKETTPKCCFYLI